MDLLYKNEEGAKLFIGNSYDARDEKVLREIGITAVVNVARDLNDPFYPGIKYYKAGMIDQ